MILDCTGTDSSSEDPVELDSAGPGEGLRSRSGAEGARGCARGLSGDLLVVEVIGRDDRRLRPVPSDLRPATVFPGRGDVMLESRSTAVLVEAFRDMSGRAD